MIVFQFRWDVHVLTGSLKLFFRELHDPLIPWTAFLAATEILKATGGGENKNAAIKIRKIVEDTVMLKSLNLKESEWSYCFF